MSTNRTTIAMQAGIWGFMLSAWALFAIFWHSLPGAYVRSIHAGATVYSIHIWAMFAAMLIPLLPALYGVFFFLRGWRRGGAALTIVSLFVAVFAMPFFSSDRVEVSEDRLVYARGFWWLPWPTTSHNIALEDVKQVMVATEEREGENSTITDYFADFTFKDGRQERMELNHLEKQAWPEVTQHLDKRRIPVGGASVPRD